MLKQKDNILLLFSINKTYRFFNIIHQTSSSKLMKMQEKFYKSENTLYRVILMMHYTVQNDFLYKKGYS